MSSKEKDFSWSRQAENFLDEGNFSSMRACGREILDENLNNPEGWALVAEASVYLEDFETAEAALNQLWNLDSQRSVARANLRGLFATAAFYGAQFILDKAMDAYDQLFNRFNASVGKGTWGEISHKIIERGYGFYADTCLLAGEGDKAAAATFKASRTVSDMAKKAMYHSKALFLTNYRDSGSNRQFEQHKQYAHLLRTEMKFPHDKEKRRKNHSLRIGYISPDFRQHAAAYFFTPLLRDINRNEFKVYAYFTGKSDHITQRFKKMPDVWRDMSGKDSLQVARQIFDDRIDILVDLSGHTQNSCLPVLGYRPAPVQVSGIGYINTTGLSVVDYFLTDTTCCPAVGDQLHFTEKLLKLDGCHLCFSPDILRSMKAEGRDTPAQKNGYVTYGSFNNFAKVTDDMLLRWRNILDGVPSKLVIKSKTCSVEAGRNIIRDRFRRIGGDPEKLELRPFSKDYLTQYLDIDIALDTSPYCGGLTTCDALYMGVPVITLAGHSHGSRYGETILKAAGLPELICNGNRAYVSKAVQLGRQITQLNELHHNLPKMIRTSPLMDNRTYMTDIENKFKQIWDSYCKV
ncbi:hypothetical protein [Anaerovibrio sp. RM50]|uniref:O-linked N-acetylglucosamine transferase, SPINDLY family protein n=1 Tax=Anaerovibrio sp. RM50 TaxID=1200557 RepID=UPI000AD653BC|nr:hypothetical protein [Anaerovibrio sp. RM50]